MSIQNLLPYLHISFTIYNIDICKQGNNLIHRSYIMPIMCAEMQKRAQYVYSNRTKFDWSKYFGMGGSEGWSLNPK